MTTLESCNKPGNKVSMVRNQHVAGQKTKEITKGHTKALYILSSMIHEIFGSQKVPKNPTGIVNKNIFLPSICSNYSRVVQGSALTLQ